MQDQVEDIFKQAESQFRKEQYAKALLLYTQVLQIMPQHTTALFQRALTKYKLRNVPGALMDLTSLLRLNPNHIIARIKRREYALDMAINDEAILLEEFPLYYEQIQEKYAEHALPIDAQSFRLDALRIYEQHALQAEDQQRWQEAIHYWQFFHETGGAIDHSGDDVIARINLLEQKLNRS